jgi:hypothetical protein
MPAMVGSSIFWNERKEVVVIVSSRDIFSSQNVKLRMTGSNGDKDP